jgi:poly-beta-1,6-N-acetyl-D-glucosamine biosynthesis protein PgaD
MTAKRGAHRVGTRRLIFEFAATTFFWGVWAYFVTPLVTLILWYAGFRVFFAEMVERSGYQAFVEQLEQYGMVVLAMLLATLAWVYWNARRYGGVYNIRTRTLAPVSLMESADMAGLSPEEVERIQYCPRLVVDFTRHNHLVVRDCSEPGSRLAVDGETRIS